MPQRIVLPDVDAEDTKCSICKHYLSVPPIVIHANNIACGRCVKDHNLLKDNRAYFYEKIAKLMFFPCKNYAYGCLVKTLWGAVLDHENSCTYQRITCPAIDCKSKVVIHQIVQHFEISHQDLILNNSPCHFLPCKKTNSNVNRLLIWRDQHFILQTRTRDDDTFFRVSSLRGDIKRIDMQLKGKSSTNLICFNKFAVMKYYSKTPICLDKEKLNISSLKEALGSEITCTFALVGEAKVRLDQHDLQFLHELKCTVCSDYIKPPVYTCNKGHNLCRQCSETPHPCSSDTATVITRNYSLEKIVQIIRHPCRNKDQGCEYVANFDSIALHESNCSLSEIGCLLKSNGHCGWRGRYATAFHHLSTLHPESCVQVGNSVTLNILAGNTIRRFLLYDRNIFAVDLHVKGRRSKIISWSISCLSNEIGPGQYMFLLEIMRHCRIISVNGTVGVKKPDSSIPHYYSKLCVFKFEDRLPEKEITFKVNLSYRNV